MSGINHSVHKLLEPPPTAASCPASAKPLVQLEGVSKHFSTASGPFAALSDVSASFDRGQLVVITGCSGSGKSTLLSLIAALDEPTRGRIRVAGADLAQLDEGHLARFRGSHIGVVFQFFQLLPTLSCLENLLLAMDLVGKVPRPLRRPRALELLRRMGIEDQAQKLPDALSGGQQQRVAIARALANDPPLIVADEPTGNLDSQTAGEVFAFLRALADEGRTVLVVSHEKSIPVRVDGCVRLQDGRVIEREHYRTAKANKTHGQQDGVACTA